MTVHLVLRDDYLQTPEAADAAVERIVAISGLRDINRKRLEAFGILSGDVDLDQIPLLRTLDEVESVELDHVRRVTA